MSSTSRGEDRGRIILRGRAGIWANGAENLLMIQRTHLANLQTDPQADPQNDPISMMCRGLAHELSNTLTFMLPTFQEIGSLHDDLLALLPGAAAASRPADEALREFGARVTPDDLHRINRQLQLSESRLRRFYQDLRLGFAVLQPEQVGPVALDEVVRSAAAPYLPPRAKAPVLDIDPLPAAIVNGDPSLIIEGMSRLLRSAIGWAYTVDPGQRVRLSLVLDSNGLNGPNGPSPTVRVRALLPGAPSRLPPPANLLQMLCPGESGSVRAERGPLGIVIGVHLFRIHGGDLTAASEADGVALFGDLPGPAWPGPAPLPGRRQ